MNTSDHIPAASWQVRVLAWLRAQRWLRDVYHALPHSVRERALHRLTRRIRARTAFVRTPAWRTWQSSGNTPAASVAKADPSLPGVNIIGFIHGQFGLAEAARGYARALIDNGVPVALHDIDLGLPNAREDHALDTYVDSSMPHAVSIFFVNPDYLAQALASIGQDRLQGRHLIACWFWELENIPAEWVPALDLVDEVLVATGFIEQAVQRVTVKPVMRVPMPLGAPQDSGLQRVDFGLPGDAFVFLATFDFSSRMERKNPGAVIRAFRQAFPAGRRDVCLLVKSSNGHRFPHWLKHLQALADGDDRIIIRDEVIERQHLHALQRCCDAYVSLHRAEGFGLGLAECMALGKPVIATGWSGNMEFMDTESAALVDFSLVPIGRGEYPCGDGQRWADPDTAQAARWMQRLADDPAAAAQLGDRGRRNIEKVLSARAAVESIVARTRQIQNQMPHSAVDPSDVEVRGMQ